MRELLLVRHGQSEQDIGDLTGGWTDTGLTELGKTQARRAAVRLKELLAEREVTIFCSDLARSAQTASILANELRAEAKLREDLREMNNGRAAGMTREEAKKLLLPQTESFADWRPYPEAESWHMMVERIFSAMERIDQQVDGSAIIVAHPSCGMAMVQWWLRMLHSLDAKVSFELDPGSISRMVVNRWGERTLVRLNDTSHLLNVDQEAERPGECEREISRRIMGQGKFLNLQLIRWVDRQGRERVWEVAERTGGTSAVMILAWLVPSDRLVLVKQYRPPAKAEVIEFPAGLVDEGESPEAAALRELHEETGYRGEVRDILKAAYNTPGMASEAAYPVLVEIDEARSENAKPVAAPAEGEDMQVILVAREQIGSFVKEQMDNGVSFDAKVIAYLAGLTS